MNMNLITKKLIAAGVVLSASWSTWGQNTGLYRQLDTAPSRVVSGQVQPNLLPRPAITLGSAGAATATTVLTTTGRYLVTHDSQGSVTSIIEVSRTRE